MARMRLFLGATYTAMIDNETFTLEQKEYLAGFFAGAAQKMPFLGQNAAGQFTSDPGEAEPETVFGTPLEELCKEERIKFEQNGLDSWDSVMARAEEGRFADGDDIFRFKFHGLFYVTPAQEAYMLRCRIAGGELMAHQMIGLAEIAEDWGGGYLDITTRNNFQIREILPENSYKTLLKLREIGLTSQGSGADNIRNITASPTTGYDPTELIDVMPYAKAMHYYILHNRDLYGLPRKFNISFDRGGRVSVCADTNDIGFYACRVGEGQGVDAGVYFRVQLCGITGHKQFAKDCGLLIRPDQAVPLAAAMIRVFIENGDRTNRKKARLKYLIDEWGVEKFLEETQKKLTFDLVKLPQERCELRREVDQHGHLGVHKQTQEGLNYMGVAIPVGRMSPNQLKAVADIATRFGTGQVRLTVWQNLIIPNIADEDVDAVKSAIREIGFDCEASFASGGFVACTGIKGCKFASADTKGHAKDLMIFLKDEIELDVPVNIHLTGCHHSCAQHYVGDIGLIATRVKVGDDSVEGYNIVVGGGVDNKQAIAREVFKSVPCYDIKSVVGQLLSGYKEQRKDGENFWEFANRMSVEQLRELGEVVSA